ncbi:hypothetical protein [Sporomusa termitida]|uniref:Uncharacterized protein n=1 Tax=Sporomusa termitida TaxID=2377 RepID=A0A517DS28_9FIRM|nr:hypothetical protein [Sporomusa termitida]QDR80149.1 hypothetical protein SPTER_14650 [Sporomusa termitida]
MTSKKSAFWNGKNFAGESQAGSQNLIAEGPRTTSSQAKYEVSNETLAAADLQPAVKATGKETK